MKSRLSAWAVLLLATFAASTFWLPGAARASNTLEARPFTVVAVVDQGINPYQSDFARSDLVQHPSTYISGFPSDVPALPLSAGAPNMTAALAQDRTEWAKVRPSKLYWIPGTNVIGAIDLSNDYGQYPILDSAGHGTPSASLAAGAIHGPDTDDILLVVIRRGEGYESVKWAAEQPWIDVIVANYLRPTVIPLAEEDAVASRLAVANGKIVCSPAGNYPAPLMAIASQGPSWLLHVGAASARSRGEHAYTGYPNDVLGLSGVKAADAFTLGAEFEMYGTSASAPAVCGAIARTIADLRAAAGDFREGPHEGAFVISTEMSAGAFSDHKVTRVELEDAIEVTAEPAKTTIGQGGDGYSVPSAPVAGFVRGGYGIVDASSAGRAYEFLLGVGSRPSRTLEDAWSGAIDRLRDLVWGSPP